MSYRLLVLLAAALLAHAAEANAQDAKRKAGAHQHGHGKLNVAIEGNRVEMELEAPGADIVGFERKAESAADKAKVATAKETLASGTRTFALDPAAGCTLTSAEAEEEIGQDGHSEFHVRYVYDCRDVAKLAKIEMPYFSTFKNAEELEVTLITAKGQKVREVGRKKPLVEIDRGLR